jgi:membrane associated rhomboid family serine protease
MTLILISLAVILTTHFVGIFSPYPITLTHGHCTNYWSTYIYGDFVHLNTYHLITDAVAFLVIYCLSPLDNIYRTGKYAVGYVLIFLVMNTLINIFVMSRFYPDAPVHIYYGISAAEFTLFFMTGILWLKKKTVYGVCILILGSLLVSLPFITNGLSTTGVLGEILNAVSLDHNIGHVAVWAHLTGAVLGIPAAFMMKVFRAL